MAARIRQATWMLVSCLGMVLPRLAPAAVEPGYTYVEAGYLHTDFDRHGDGSGLLGIAAAVYLSLWLPPKI